MSLVVALSAAQSAFAVRIDWEKDPVEKVVVKKTTLMGRRIGKYSKIASCKDSFTQMVANDDGEIEVELYCEATDRAVARFSFPELSRGGHSGGAVFWGDELVAARGGLFGEFLMVEGFVLKSKVVPVSIDNRPAGVMIFVSISRAVKDETPAPFPGTRIP